MTTETISLKGNISPRTEKWIRISAVLAMFVVALSSAILSFDGLKKVALDAKIPEHLAFLFPIAVDTTILMGSLAVLLYELFGVRAVFGWVTVLFGTLLSIVGNVISVKDAGLIAQVLHGIIPVLLCISLESLLRILRFNIKRTRLAGDGTVSRDSVPAAKPIETVSGKTAEIQEPKVLAPAPVTVLTTAPVPSISKEPEPKPLAVPSVAPVAVTVQEPAEVAAPIPTPPKAVQPPKEPDVAPVASEKPQALPVANDAVEAPSVEPDAPEAFSSNSAVRPVATEKPVAVKDVETKPKAVETVKPAPAVTANSGNDNVERYKFVIESLPAETPKARKVAEILRAYPAATASDIKTALGDPPELRIDGTMRRAKEWLKKQ